jgi:hypothetical protein
MHKEVQMKAAIQSYHTSRKDADDNIPANL